MARILAAGSTLLAVLMMAAPVLRAPTSLALGAPQGEGPAHLWGLVTAAEGLPRHGPFVRDSTLVAWPGGVHLDLVDPLHLLLVAPGQALGGLGGAVLGWNLLHLLHLLVLAGGAWALGRHLAPGRPLVAAVATAGAVATPYLWGGVPLGRTELLGLTFLPALLALLGRGLRPTPARPALAGAALLLAALAACGWQPLVQAGLVLAPATLVLARHHGVPGRRLAARLALVVLPAALLSLPMLLAHLGTSPWWLDRLGGMEVLGRDAPPVDLPGALRLRGLRPPMDTVMPPYLGLFTLLLAGLALARGPRRWGLLGLLLALLCLGPRFTLLDPVQRWLGPAWLLARALPPLGGLNDWGRLALAAGPLLAVIGALALHGEREPRRAPAWAALACMLLLADGLSWRIQAPAAFPVAPPEAVVASYAGLPDGPVLELPGSSPDEAAAQADSDRSLLWTLTHRHPVQAAPSPFGSPMLPRSLLIRVHQEPRPRPGDPCFRTEPGRLHALGFRSVVLHHDRLQELPAADLVARLRPALGPPTGQDPTLSWWVLAPGEQGPARCAPPPLGSEGRQDTGPNRFGAPPLSADWSP